MRLLVDEKDLAWEEAWDITQATLGYTNHTLAPEALEKWPVPLLESVLPRHLQIIYEINRRFLDRVSAAYPGDVERLRRMSLIEESTPKQVRMAHLAIVGSHSINGVSALHTELVKTALVAGFLPVLAGTIQQQDQRHHAAALAAEGESAAGGSDHRARSATAGSPISDQLRALEKCAQTMPTFQAEFRAGQAVEQGEAGASSSRTAYAVKVDPDSLFDMQVKRIHAYKRQLLNVMHIIDEYLSLIEDGRQPAVPRTYIFAGKAAPGYWAAKQIIKLIHDVARVINSDPRASEWIKVVFVPDYRVSLAEKIIPAADLSEQISTAGTEASGTGNMKFALNGAVTIGTLDGANIEILRGGRRGEHLHLRPESGRSPDHA